MVNICVGYGTTFPSGFRFQSGLATVGSSRTDMRVHCTHAPAQQPSLVSQSQRRRKKRSMSERKRSIIWTYFTAVSSNEATCDLCTKCVKYCGNTTNLTKHLKVNHIKEHDDLQRRRLEESEREGVQGNAPTPAVRMRQTSLMEALQQRSRQYPGMVKYITVPTITGIKT